MNLPVSIWYAPVLIWFSAMSDTNETEPRKMLASFFKLQAVILLANAAITYAGSLWLALSPHIWVCIPG